MKRNLWAILFVLAVGFLAIWSMGKNTKNSYKQGEISLPNNTISQTPMNITSPKFENNQSIPEIYACDGQGINPPLEISNVPGQAKSLALIMDDPDAPSGTWVHWLLWNIDPGTKLIAENTAPFGSVQGKASSGQNVYRRPLPAFGHAQVFF